MSRPWCEVALFEIGSRFELATSQVQVRYSTTQPLAGSVEIESSDPNKNEKAFRGDANTARWL